MNSYRTPKLNSDRPGLSARVYDYEKDNNDSLDRTSKSSKLPKRTYSLEGKRITCSDRKSNTKNTKPKTSTSMIPRLDRNKQVNTAEKGFSKRVSTPNNSINKEKKANEPQFLKPTNSEKEELGPEPRSFSPAPETLHLQTLSAKTCSLESKVNKDFICFKNNVLRIPEYWTDAGQTVTNILKNAVNIVMKQYPTTDMESFETEIQNILKATEVVKEQILSKTENIINRANKIYVDRSDLDSDSGEEDLQKITRKMEDLKNEVNVRKNVFGDLLKYGSEMKQLIELEKALKQRGLSKESLKKELPGEVNQNHEMEEQHKRLDGKKGKSVVDSSPSEINKRDKKNVLQSCGDILRQEVKTTTGPDETDGKLQSELGREDKYTQTTNFWTAELYKREEDLKELNNQIIELQKLCQDHISKFKSFNLQIKLRGLCNRAQHTSFSKEIQILNDEKLQLAEKNSKLRNYNQDLESAIKQRDLDIHQKDRLISQQKKLLNVRDELIEMLKSRCNFEETKHFG